jgi:hypothetical protein
VITARKAATDRIVGRAGHLMIHHEDGRRTQLTDELYIALREERRDAVNRIRARIGQTALARPDQPWKMIAEILDEEAAR